MAQATQSPGSLRITRVTLPRFELEYRDAELALTHARSIKKDKGLILDEEFKAAIGQEVVIDFLVRDRPLRATLLFRLVQVSGQAHILEWWSRRSTDPEILDIWIAGLEGQETPVSSDESSPKEASWVTGTSDFPEEYAHAESHAARSQHQQKPALTRAQRDEILALCRRLMLHNPFAALGIHWTAIESEQRSAAERAQKSLSKAENRCLGDAQLLSFIQKAKQGVNDTLAQLKTVDKRRAIRQRFLTREQIESSVSLARHQLEMAKFRGETHEVKRLTALLEEIAGTSKE